MLWRTRTPVPGFIVPCQPSAAAKPPAGPDWWHEIKHDGCRLMAWREGARVRLFTRNGYDWADRYPAIVEAVGALKVTSCLIDAEVIVCDARGLDTPVRPACRTPQGRKRSWILTPTRRSGWALPDTPGVVPTRT